MNALPRWNVIEVLHQSVPFNRMLLICCGTALCCWCLLHNGSKLPGKPSLRSARTCRENMFLSLCMLPLSRNVFTMGFRGFGLMTPPQFHGILNRLHVRNAWIIMNGKCLQMHTLSRQTHTQPQCALDSNDGCASIIRIKLNNSEPEQLQSTKCYQEKKKKY